VVPPCFIIPSGCIWPSSSWGRFGNERFFHDGRTGWKIYVSPQATPTETFAAEELRDALRKISGADVPATPP
jgi:hypothetical protein